jgi:hypothetical protein
MHIPDILVNQRLGNNAGEKLEDGLTVGGRWEKALEQFLKNQADSEIWKQLCGTYQKVCHKKLGGK